MSELLKQGLEISVVGLGLTFAALGLLILMMVILERLFRPTSITGEEEASIPDRPTAETTEDEEIAAAIGVAIHYLKAQQVIDSSLGANLEKGQGAWWRRGQSDRFSRFPSKKTKEQLK